MSAGGNRRKGGGIFGNRKKEFLIPLGYFFLSNPFLLTETHIIMAKIEKSRENFNLSKVI
jgi:hypothetical protein